MNPCRGHILVYLQAVPKQIRLLQVKKHEKCRTTENGLLSYSAVADYPTQLLASILDSEASD